ncbi:hypothetical protein, partial [Maridesulfovibrio hydrothermalis]
YREAIAVRKKIYEELRSEQDERWEQNVSYWDNKIKSLRNDRTLRPKDRSRLIALAAGKKIEAIESLKKEMAGKRAELRKQTPFNRWNDFLKWKAESGDEVALQVLRSKKAPIERKVQQEFAKADPSASNWKLRQSQIRMDSSLVWKDKRKLISIAKMLQLQAEEAKRSNDTNKRSLDKITWRVDSSGNVLYSLKSGGMVKDNGDKIFFSINDPTAKIVAEKLAKRMFGANIKIKGNEIYRMQRKVMVEQSSCR